jgi:DNA-binding CsgD family transcriptional regulator
MSEPSTRLVPWLSLISDLLGEQLRELPHEVIADQLRRTFSVTGIAFNWSDSAGRQQMITWPADQLSSVTDLEEWTRGDSRGAHPLIRWHVTTGDPRATTIGRVPAAVVPLRDREPLLSGLRRLKLDQQLAINLRLGHRAFHTYVLGRGSRDFSDEDVEVARHVQRALIGLDRQVEVLRRLRQDRNPALDAGLTAREVYVLTLLAAGHSTRTAARRLGCSPRTVEKHLERVFRKLGVRDRLNAVRVAQLWGLTGAGTG